MTDASQDFFAGFSQSATPGATPPADTLDPASTAEQTDEQRQQSNEAAGRENDPAYWRARFEQANGQQRKVAAQLKEEAEARERAEADAQRARTEADDALRRANETAALAAQLNDPPKTDQQPDPELEALQQTAPTVMAGVQKLIDRELEPMRKRATAAEAEARHRAEQAAAVAHSSAIAAKHPDWIKVGQSAGFNVYIDSLPPWQKQSALRVRQAGSADEVVSLLDSYKQSGSPSPIPESHPDDMSFVPSNGVRPNAGNTGQGANDDFGAGWAQSVRG
jgi:hypothetical protein